MPPIPPPRDREQQVRVPPLHLKATALAHPGCDQFFQAGPPKSLLTESTKQVVQILYPNARYKKHSQDSVSDDDSTDSLIESHSAGNPPWRPPHIRSITLYLREFDGVAHTKGSDIDNAHKEIHFSTKYLADLSDNSNEARHEIVGVLVHELVHAFQYNGKGTCHTGLVEGIADWVRLRAGLGGKHWRRDASGGPFDGYTTTAYFLDYLSLKYNRYLVPTLNWRLKSNTWHTKVLEELCGGHSVDFMWAEYRNEVGTYELHKGIKYRYRPVYVDVEGTTKGNGQLVFMK